jgi:hypothetical protein
VIVPDDDEPVPQAPLGPKPFTADEDGELLLLRERFKGLASWDQISRDFNKKFPQSTRSYISLRSRYLHILQEGADRQNRGSLNQRERAIDALRKRGIELQVNDSISDSASERDEDDEGDEQDGEQNENEDEEDEEDEGDVAFYHDDDTDDDQEDEDEEQ